MTLLFTGEQTGVIRAEHGNILVSAAAGSGKTAVLTERIVARITSGLLDVQHVLVVTFTEAAARNMRDKIEDKLRAARAESRDPDARRYLSRQIALLPAAAISTIHAFCLQVIRNFYHLVTDSQGKPLVEPGFAVQDRFESDLLLRQVLDEWINSQYEAIDLGDPSDQAWSERVRAFYRLTDGYGDSRSDQPVRELLIHLFHFLRSLPDYRRFIAQKQEALADAAADFSGSLYCRTILDQLRLRLDRAMIVLPDLQSLLSGPVRFLADSRRNDEAKDQMTSALQILAGLQHYLQQGGCDWDEIRARAMPLENLALPRASQRDPVDKTAFLDLFTGHVAEVICFLTGNCGTDRFRRHFLFQTSHVFDKPVAAIEGEIREMLPAIDAFITLLIGLDERYAQQKRRAAVLDFSDFEHLALAILRQDEANRYYRERFSEVYVDEYQDTSSIQEAILQSVSQDNCLMVGDIKQSIYRFRHARPQIFRQKAGQYGAGDSGRLLELNRNFRSVTGILAAVNDVFVQLMSEGAGEIDYDGHQALVPVRPDHPHETHPVQVLLLDRNDAAAEDGEGAALQDAGDQADLDRYEMEALAVVCQMRALHAEGRAWREMVVLARTRTIMAAYRDQLEAAGIPVSADVGSAVLDSPVIRLLEGMIHVLDNWRQDIHLVTVMHGGIGHEVFSIEELALIRLFGRDNGFRFFHEAVFAYRQDGGDEALRVRLGSFLDWLAALRDKEQTLTVGELLGLVYTQTGWIDRVAAQEDGREQVRLLRRFQSWAEDFEKNRQKGLFRFARYLERLREQDLADVPIEPAVNDENLVRIMTVHGSKGLEFPVVFLVGMSGRISGSDSQAHILFSESLGIGFDYADPARRVRYPTHLKVAMLDEIRAAAMAEELRLLYVAMTRAMDRLYLVGTINVNPVKGDSRLLDRADQARRVTGRRLPDHLVRSARTFLEWVIMILARNPAVDLSFLDGQNVIENAQAATARENAAKTESNVIGNKADDAEEIPGMKACLSWSVRTVRLEDARREEAGKRTEKAADQAVSAQEQPGAAERAESPDQLRRRTIDPYRFGQAARTPLKLTVSELKRQEPLDDPDAEMLPVRPAGREPAYRGIDLALNLPDLAGQAAAGRGARLAGAALGTTLHSVFRYLDLPAASRDSSHEAIEHQLTAMCREGMLSETELAAVRPFVGVIRRFAVSVPAGALVRAIETDAGSVYQEMPFTLALPACEVYEDCGGLAPDDQVMIQGIIDCWYRDAAGITLIDYKSDYIKGSQDAVCAEIRRRYGTQMAWYARAIEELTGQPVHSRLVWHIRRGLAIPLNQDP
jgi:ATP-dependent helicase/nuclease subunit A